MTNKYRPRINEKHKPERKKIQMVSQCAPQRKQAKLSTAGACVPNPGYGGWACLLRFDNDTRELFGCESHTTNNRMELQAVIEGLRALEEPCEVTIFNDSQYVRHGIKKGLARWKANGWKNKSQKGGTVKNQDLWLELDKQIASHVVRCQRMKGHADGVRGDSLASRAAIEQVASIGIKKYHDSRSQSVMTEEPERAAQNLLQIPSVKGRSADTQNGAASRYAPHLQEGGR
jgi:ribonuclease HI